MAVCLAPDVVSCTEKPNFRNKIDGIRLMKQLANGSVKVVFFDPQYRGILDEMRYGNEGINRGQQRSALAQMSEETISQFLAEINRILTVSGYLFLWIDKFHLVEGIRKWLTGLTLLPVDMITWNKMKIGMGYRTRRKSEYLVILQKKNKTSKCNWKLHNIPDVWEEKVEKNHPHAKPVDLQKNLILATTNEEDWICDPAAGGYSVLEACRETGRNFIGGDIAFGE